MAETDPRLPLAQPNPTRSVSSKTALEFVASRRVTERTSQENGKAHSENNGNGHHRTNGKAGRVASNGKTTGNGGRLQREATPGKEGPRRKCSSMSFPR